MLQKACACIIAKDSDTDSHNPNEKDDEVYLRFGGGALEDMFRPQYKEMKSKKPSQYKEVSQELQVLQWVCMIDKSTLPPSLAYTCRD